MRITANGMCVAGRLHACFSLAMHDLKSSSLRSSNPCAIFPSLFVPSSSLLLSPPSALLRTKESLPHLKHLGLLCIGSANTYKARADSKDRSLIWSAAGWSVAD